MALLSNIVTPDGITLDTAGAGNTLEVKANGITNTQIATNSISGTKLTDSTVAQSKLSFSIPTQTLQRALYYSNSSFTVPAGVFEIMVQGCGGGSGGEGTFSDWPGHGGQGAGLHTITIPCSPGQVFGITIGAGGSGAIWNGASGSPSWFGGYIFPGAPNWIFISTYLHADGATGSWYGPQLDNPYYSPGNKYALGAAGDARGFSPGGRYGYYGQNQDGNYGGGTVFGAFSMGGGGGAGGFGTGGLGAQQDNSGQAAPVGGGGGGGACLSNTAGIGGAGGSGAIQVTWVA
jgi:hypothetical protein